MNFRVTVLGFTSTEGRIASEVITHCTNLSQLQHFFSPTEEEQHDALPYPNPTWSSSLDSSKCRLFLIESSFPRHYRACSTPYSLEGLLKSHLNVPQDLFQTHAWERTTFDFNEIINCPRLPTATKSGRRFSLEYFELWDVGAATGGFEDEIKGWWDGEKKRPKFKHGSTNITCAETGRQLQCHKWKKSEGWLLIAPRKVSFWYVGRGEGEWDVVILCDPAPGCIKVGETTSELSVRAFYGGYHGFIPDDVLASAAHASTSTATTTDSSSTRSENQKPLTNTSSTQSTTETPPHNSTFDDLLYYFTHHASLIPNLSDPHSLALFPRKLVASHYCQLLGFVSHQTASMRSSGWAVQRRTQEEIEASNQVETAWSQFKCPEYLEALNTVLDALGISADEELRNNKYHSSSSIFKGDQVEEELGGQARGQREGEGGMTDWRSPTSDFLFLHREFRLRLSEYARMTSSLAALNGIIGGRLGILEARTAKSLTLVAMIFAPPACVASIFSIQGNAAADSRGFWQYWAAAVPLTVLVFLGTYLVHERDGVRRGWRRSRGKWVGDGS
ncbi:uncharacterized protein BCR38DRAFT_481625 [Pseudomassariella vexata]|uniref:Uncharacterized protein n=1 Tax=Pseudomassariella vexata TaxID=1141098 RepID=A0A1Y2EGR6_9PEZI|nr:uncharacterized protein BCR38DRAFT_481625 [Pseudomassariella vexata]ORY70494.1 hypothetical protein BCR38DRAFT_481625 [Pseudomassariella vexata]